DFLSKARAETRCSSDMYIVRRSGRLSNRKMGYQDEVIDLTSPEWDEAEEFINDEPNEHVYGAQETLKKDMDVYIDANNAANINDTLDESARVQVEKTENRKVPRKARKDKLVALAAKRKIKQGEKVNHGSNGQGVVRKGKLAAIVEKTKKEQAEKGTGKRVAVKRKKAVLCEKGNKKQVVVENGNIRDNKAADELDDSTDDDFVTNVGARHGPGMDKEKGFGRKKWMMIQHDL
ncbi:hypothetical protein Tco_1258480, partial [Tanacetum coccineum]